MIGLDPLTLSTLLILAGGRATCPSHAPTKINIIPSTEEIRYDYSQTLEQLQSYETDTIDPYEFRGRTVTQGFMRGGIGVRHKVSFAHDVKPSMGYACIWYDSIDVELNIDPEIVIAKELYYDSCMRKSIIEHELKHVRVDREVVNKYAQTIGKRLFEALKARGFSVGPIKEERLLEVRSKMQRVVNQILELEYKKMNIERRERQLEVDSLEEYDSVDDKCPGFEKKKKKLYKKAISY